MLCTYNEKFFCCSKVLRKFNKLHSQGVFCWGTCVPSFFPVSRHIVKQRHLVRKRNFLSEEWEYRNLGRDDELERSWDIEHSSVLSRLSDIERLSCHLSSMMLTGYKDELPERSRKRSQIFLIWLSVPSKPPPLIAITLLWTWHLSHDQLIIIID